MEDQRAARGLGFFEGEFAVGDGCGGGVTDEQAGGGLEGIDALLNLEYGKLITMLIMAAYMSHEKGKVVNLTDEETLNELEDYVPLIQQGRGRKVL